MATQSSSDFEANFDEGFSSSSTPPTQQLETEQVNYSSLISEQNAYPPSLQEEQVYYSSSATETYTSTGDSTIGRMNNNNAGIKSVAYVPTIIPEDIVHQYGITALTLDQIQRSVFVSLNTPVENLSVQEISNFFSFCGSVEKIIIVDA